MQHDLTLCSGADINAQDEVGETCLHAAIRAGQAAIAEKFLSQGITNASALTHKEQTPLHYLGLYPRDKALQIFQALARRISELNPVDAEGNAPLYYAYLNGAAALCKALVQSGAHLSLPNKQGLSCFDVQAPNKKLLYQLIGMAHCATCVLLTLVCRLYPL